MPNAAAAYARPSDDIAPSATWSLTSGAAAGGYPVANVKNLNPAKPFKATGTSATLRATYGSPQTIVAIAILNHNLAGLSALAIQSGSGLNQALTVPPNAGGQCVPFIVDLSTLSSVQRTSTTFDLVVTTTVLGNVAIGEVLLLTSIRDLWVSWGQQTQPQRLVIDARTFGGSPLLYNKRVLVHRLTGQVEPSEYEATLRTLETEAEGSVHPWLVWPDVTVSRCHYVKFSPGTFRWTRQAPNLSTIPVDLEEMSAGPPLFP